MSDIVLFGAGQIADVARVYIDTHGPDRIVGFTVDASHRTADTFCGRPLVPWEELERFFPPSQVKLLGPLSFRRLNEFRKARYMEAKARGYSFTSFIHPNCQVYTTDIGENCFILENNTLQPFSKIGNNVIIWSNNHIGHHSTIDDHCFLASHVGVSSNAVIEAECFIGGKTGIDYGVTVGARSFLGTGSMVLNSLPPDSVVLGESSPLASYSSRRLKRFV